MGETISARPKPPPRHTSIRGASEIVAGLRSGRAAARAWSLTIPERQRQQAAWSFVKAAIDGYILTLQRTSGTPIHVSAPAIALVYQLDQTITEMARTLGEQATQVSIEQACYQLSATYTALVPAPTRSALGMYYTPPALAHRMLDMAEKSGIDWKGARVLDPACGGGAFLLPAAMRIRAALAHLGPELQLDAIANQLCGFEIDPFGAWLSQAWLEIGLTLLRHKNRRHCRA